MSTFIIAEAGINHQNSIGLAEQMIRAAKDAGADAVKFQASTVMEEVSFKADPDHFAELGKLVPTWDFLRNCKALCDAHDIEFMCTPAGLESLTFVYSLGVKRMKVSSDNINNVPFLRAVATLNMPVILSTGMSTLEDVMKASGLLASQQHRLTLLHCVSLYPCPLGLINLRGMLQLRRYGIVGLSDHTESPIVPALAVAMGAEVIEKHITLDKGMAGPDHAASLEPHDFWTMVQFVRHAEMALQGTGDRAPVGGEGTAAQRYRKSLVAAAPIKAGETFTIDNLTAKRPGTGRSAGSWDSVIGTKATRSYEVDELIE